MKGRTIRTLSQNDYTNSKENNNRHYPKVTFNLLDKPNSKELDIKAKYSMLPSNPKLKNFPRKVNSFLNLHYNNINEPKKLLKKLTTKANLEIDGVPTAKSSLNVKNNLITKSFIAKAKLNKTKSQYEPIENNEQNKKNNLKQTKNNFLKLITKSNEGEYIREYGNLKGDFLNKNDSLELNEEDSLEKVEKKLQDRILDRGKEVEFMEFEVGPLDMTINDFSNKKRRKRLITKKTKDSDTKKSEKRKIFMTTAIRQKKNMLSVITSINSRNAISDNYIFNKSRENLDDSNKLFFNEKKNNNKHTNVHKHTNFIRKLKFGASNIKQSKITNNLKKSIMSNDKKSYNLNFYDKFTSIFKTNHPKFFPKKSTVLTKSKTYSNIDSKIVQTFITSAESLEKSNSLSSDKDMPHIDKEKFRVL